MSSIGFLPKILFTMGTKDRFFWRTCPLIPGIEPGIHFASFSVDRLRMRRVVVVYVAGGGGGGGGEGRTPNYA